MREFPFINSLRIKDLVWFIQNKWGKGSFSLPNNIENKISIDSDYEAYVYLLWIVNLGNLFNEDNFDTMILRTIKMKEECIIQKNKM